MRKINYTIGVALCAIIILTVGGCEGDPSGPGSDGLENTQSRLFVEYTQRDSAAVVTINTNGNPVADDLTFNARVEVISPIPEVDGGLTDVYLDGYHVQYFNVDPDGYPLTTRFFGRSVVVESDSSTTLSGFTYWPWEHTIDWYNNGNPLREAEYEVVLTWVGYNEYGYEVSLESKFYVMVYLDDRYR